LLRSVKLPKFFFSSRRRHTRFSRDWSSDVCSSDLSTQKQNRRWPLPLAQRATCKAAHSKKPASSSNRLMMITAMKVAVAFQTMRSEERRVGKECRKCGSSRNQTEERSEVNT